VRHFVSVILKQGLQIIILGLCLILLLLIPFSSGDHMDAAEYKRVIKGLSEERKWREWADNYLVHTLSPNVYRTLDESLHTFETFSIVGEWDVHFPDWERVLVIYLGAFVMWIIGKRLKKRHGLKEDIRESLYDATREWLMFVKKSGHGNDPAFAGGMKPNLADLSVYGVYKSIDGTDAFSEILMHPRLGKSFKKWYTAMTEYVMTKRGSRDLIPIIKQRLNS
jgi:microsomal prostaglandin-E synthase 2